MAIKKINKRTIREITTTGSEDMDFNLMTTPTNLFNAWKYHNISAEEVIKIQNDRINNKRKKRCH